MPYQILIVDDDPAILRMMQKYLGDTLGYGVTTVSSGEEALDAAGKKKYSLCMLDVRMPGLSGTETYMRLKNINPEIEAIFITADAEFETKFDFLRFSLTKDRVLTKPIHDLSILTRLITSILGPPIR
jgi:CheY-like chemotaxis protein